MKTFIFTFFLLAGHSFWETKSQASSGPACLLKSADEVPEVLTDFADLLCTVNSKIPAEQKVEKIRAFVDKYTDLVTDCNIIEVLGLKTANLRDVTTESAADIVKTVLETLESWGFTNNAIQLLCNQAACVAKIIGPVIKDFPKDPKNILNGVKCEEKGSLVTRIDDLIKKICIPDKELGDSLEIVLKILRGKIMNNPAVKRFICL
ncbi:uncharacterized protein LOC143928160 [Lithobates pipiens]